MTEFPPSSVHNRLRLTSSPNVPILLWDRLRTRVNEVISFPLGAMVTMSMEDELES